MTYADRRKLGLCARCGKVESPTYHCPKCSEYLKKYKKATSCRRRAKRLESGTCTRCGNVQAVPGNTECAICINYRNSRAKSRSKEDISNGLCTKCRQVPVSGTRLCHGCRQKFNQQTRTLKEKVLGHYGTGCQCAGCPLYTLVIDRRFLTIDHVANDGKHHRAVIGKGSHKFYRWLIRNGFPAGFQTLCWNCNLGKSLNGGICPHSATSQGQFRTGASSGDPSPGS